MAKDEDTAPGWAMKEGADMSWPPMQWPRRWMKWAFIALSLAVLAFNAVRMWG